jgi:alpha-L-rhamnosidase
MLTTVVVAAGCTATAMAASRSETPQWPSHVDWARYVVAPATRDVSPVRVVRTSGAVTGAKALASPPASASAGGGAKLTMTTGGEPAVIEVDYGKDIDGIPFFVVRSESRSPVLRATYSEGRQYIGPQGDGTPSRSAAGDPSRVDNLTVTGSGRLTTGLIQGGERYERITLASPGSVTLSSIGIRFTAVRATAQDYQGWFDSSSQALNRIWYDGAYTTQLDELRADTLPPPWQITGGALAADGGSIGVLRAGSTWTDYTMTFDIRVVDNQAGWVVRAGSSSSGYLFLLDDATDSAGAPDTLREVAFGPAEFSVIGQVALPVVVTAGSWHRVQTEASGAQITTSIDGRRVAAFDTASLPSGASAYGSGTVGFAALGSEALIRNLDVTGPGRTTLYANRFSSSSDLAAFSGPNVATPDPLPVIMDGAKRDRVVWSGDLGVEGPNVFYTTGSDGFVRGSLDLLASYQEADGESGTNVPPPLRRARFPRPATTTRRRTRWTRWTTSPRTTSTPGISLSCGRSGR